LSAQSVPRVGTHFGGGSAGCERSGRPGDVPLQKGPEGCDGKGRKRKALTHRLYKRGESHERFFTLKNKLLAEQVEDQIYHYILDTPIEPGAKLPNEFELGEKFGVGRSTIREALKHFKMI